MGPAASVALALVMFGWLAGCDSPKNDGQAASADAPGEALPAPQRAGGSITGMPGQPGPGQVGIPTTDSLDSLDPLPEPVFDSEGNPIDPLPVGPDGLAQLPSSAPGAPSDVARAGAVADGTVADGPGADEAVAVVGAYYGAINAGSYGRAYALWGDGGNASGQSPQQFADGFDDTAEVSVEIMTPGRIDAAAGSRYIEVPVAVSATRDDGSVHKYVGAYTLRRAVVDGATSEQRAWRIASADLREVQP